MHKPLPLPHVTMVAITDRDHGKTIEAILKSLQHVQPARTILFSDVPLQRDEFENIVIQPLRSAKKYNEFVTWELGKYPIDTSHILLVQHDGYVLDATAWTDEFLQYDYIGAPWMYTDGRNVGNGGFSLRSTKLHQILSIDRRIQIGTPEDEVICRFYREYLEKTHGIRYAPDELAHKFSFEMHKPKQSTFGFHNIFHKPWKEPVILQHRGCMGDLLMLEPVMEYFHNHGKRVIIDCNRNYFVLLSTEYYLEFIGDLQATGEDYSTYRTIGFEGIYESKPKQIVYQSYFEAAGIKDYKLRNASLNWRKSRPHRLFDKYVIFHVNETDMPHRNIRGIEWNIIRLQLKMMGYQVFQLGTGAGPETPTINATGQHTLAFIIGCADLFIGSDSGPAQIAAACGVKSIIFFGSVLPRYRYLPADHIFPIHQEVCPFVGCYHDVISHRGQDCAIEVKEPPCCNFDTKKVTETLNKILYGTETIKMV